MSYTISAVSAETGIAKEVLRKWETRYGFPTPGRDADGDRTYPLEQVHRLKLIKRLIDNGMRPNQVVALDEVQLRALITHSSTAHSAESDATQYHAHLIDWLKARDPALLRINLRAELERLGLEAFVLNVMPSMNKRVGDAWATGEIAVRDEHLYTEILTGLIREALPHAEENDELPRVLITTPPGELHVLGILMVEAALTSHGVRCISLGAQSPLPEILLAADDFAVHVVALSFSESYPKRKIVPLLRELRSGLPAEVQLWAGGAGTIGLEKIPRGTIVLPSLNEAIQRMANHPRLHKRNSGSP